MQRVLSPLAVAAVQFVPVPRDVSANVAASVTVAHAAADAGARLVVFPELSLIGYDLTALSDPGVWTSATDPRLDPLRDVAHTSGATLVIGAPWRDPDGTPRLASVVLHPDRSHMVAPKEYLHGAEHDVFAPGTEGTTVGVEGWRVALAVCFDAAHPEHAARAVARGADLYAVSALYVEGQEPRVDLHLADTAARHGIPTLLSNLGGDAADGARSSCGLSGTWGVDGARRTLAAGTGADVAADLLVPA